MLDKLFSDPTRADFDRNNTKRLTFSYFHRNINIEYDTYSNNEFSKRPKEIRSQRPAELGVRQADARNR